MARRSNAVRIVLACATCRSRGWLSPSTNDWPDVCPHCKGLGRIDTFAGLARRLGLPRDTLRRVAEGRATRNGLHILTRIADVYPEAVAP